MHWQTLTLCCLLLLAITTLVWFLPNWVPWVWKKPTQIKGPHDADLAFVQRMRLGVCVAVASIAVAGLMLGFIGLTVYSARASVTGSHKVSKQFIESLGLPYDKSTIEMLHAELKKDNSGTASRFLREFNENKDVDATTDDARKLAAEFLNWEYYRSSTREALLLVLTELSGQPADSNSPVKVHQQMDKPTRKLLELFLDSQLLPASLNPCTADQFMTRLEYDTELQALHRHIEIAFRESPGKRILVYAVFDKLREHVLGYRRVKAMLVDYIQAATFAMLFLALLLLRGRSEVICVQEGYDKKFLEFAGSSVPIYDDAKQALKERTAHEGNNLLPSRPLHGPQPSPEREIKIVRGYGNYRRDFDPERKRMHLFALGALHGVWVELEGKGKGEGISSAQVFLKNLVERVENRLERVEYSIVYYLLWAMPSFGFIGTVLGISQSLGSADQVVRATDSLAQANAITVVTSLLGIAFDTTLVALVCSLPVMWFVHRLRARESSFLLETEQVLTTAALR